MGIKKLPKSDHLVHGYIVEKTAKRMKQAFAKLLSEHQTDITVDQWVLMEQLAKKDGISQLELAKQVFKDAPTVTRIIDLLAKKSLVDRTTDKTDRRKFKIVLTSLGKKKFEMVNKLAIQFRKKMYNGLEIDDINKLEYILNIINTNLKH